MLRFKNVEERMRYMHTYMHPCMHIYMHIYIPTYIHTCSHSIVLSYSASLFNFYFLVWKKCKICRLYFVSIRFGNPSQEYYLDMDTGSDLTWLQCDAPCTRCAKVCNFSFILTRFHVPQNWIHAFLSSCMECIYADVVYRIILWKFWKI